MSVNDLTTPPTPDLNGLLDELDALREKATPGPWMHEHDDYGDEWWFGGSTGSGQETLNGHIVTDGASAADMAYLAAAANAVPQLVAAVRAVLDLEARWRVGIEILDDIDRFEVVNGLRAALTAALSDGAR